MSPPVASRSPVTFGQYTLIDRLAVGGMDEFTPTHLHLSNFLKLVGDILASWLKYR